MDNKEQFDYSGVAAVILKVEELKQENKISLDEFISFLNRLDAVVPCSNTLLTMTQLRQQEGMDAFVALDAMGRFERQFPVKFFPDKPIYQIDYWHHNINKHLPPDCKKIFKTLLTDDERRSIIADETGAFTSLKTLSKS